MPIEFRCTSCGKLLRTGDGTAGRQAKCPQCGAVVMVPEVPTTPPGVVPPPPMFTPPASRSIPSSLRRPRPWPPRRRSSAVPSSRGCWTWATFGRTWELFKSQLGMCLAVVLVAWLLPVGVSWVIDMFAQVAGVVSRTPAIAPLVQVVTMIPLQIFTLYLFWGMIRMLLKIARGQRFEFGELFAYRPQFWPFLGVVLLLALAYGAVIVVLFFLTLIPVYAISQPVGPQGVMTAVFISLIVACIVGCIPGAFIWLFFGQAPFLVLIARSPSSSPSACRGT